MPEGRAIAAVTNFSRALRSLWAVNSALTRCAPDPCRPRPLCLFVDQHGDTRRVQKADHHRHAVAPRRNCRACPEYWIDLTHEGYVLVRTNLAVFQPEA